MDNGDCAPGTELSRLVAASGGGVGAVWFHMGGTDVNPEPTTPPRVA